MRMKRCFIALYALIIFVAPSMAQDNGADPVVKSAFHPLEVGEIRPEGWLLDWAQKAAKGITGSIDETGWPFTRGWGDANIQMKRGEPWWPYEQTGYYTDGLIRLAYILDDEKLIAKAENIMEAVIARQDSDGYYFVDDPAYKAKWLDASGDSHYRQVSSISGSHWAIATFARGAVAYYSATGDKRALDMLVKAYKHFPLFDRAEEKYPISGTEMQAMRGLVNLEVMLEVARYSGDQEVLDRALEVYRLQESGLVKSWGEDKDFSRTTICHGVSFNEHAKLAAAAYIWNGDKRYLDASTNGYDDLFENHMLPNGVNSSNEFLRGVGAFEGSETCDISDLLWSSSWMARASEDASYGDRIERLFFNAFPAIVSPDFGEHLYETAPNRIPGVGMRHRNDGDYFKPLHWPVCCSGNLNRVIPNFIINMCLKSMDNRIALLTYAPANIKTADGDINFRVETEYPFREDININVESIPTDHSLLLRIPEWCDVPECTINNKRAKIKVGDDGFFAIKRKWSKGDIISLRFPMKAEIHQGVEQDVLFDGEERYWGEHFPSSAEYQIDGFRQRGSYATLDYGPLLFAYPLLGASERGFALNEGVMREFRYALSPQSIQDVKMTTAPVVTPFCWEAESAPIKIKVPVSKIEWNIESGDPQLPEGEITPLEEVVLELIPYGCARYRMSMFPTYNK